MDPSIATMTADYAESLADNAWWQGQIDDSLAHGETAYRAFLNQGQPRRAAWVAIGIAINHLLRGDETLGSSWLGEASRLLADQPECVEQGYLRYLLEVESALDSGDFDAVITASRSISDLGRRLRDPNLETAGLLGEGRIRIKQGQAGRGLVLLDEVMVTVLSGRLKPDWAGNFYCHMMAAACELTDFRRAIQWIQATERWLDTLPAAVLFAGICRVHRSQIKVLAGDWATAERDAAQVCDDLADIHPATVAEAQYVLGEIYRLRGEGPAAEDAYRRAHRLGRDPQPGRSLLLLARGRTAAAAAAIRAALVAADNRLVRARLCAAQVEIALAAADTTVARKAAAELAETAAAFGGPGMLADAALATGAVLLAEGRPTEALPALRDACRRWRELRAPYPCARTGLLLAEAYLALDDEETAALERDSARGILAELGAAHEFAPTGASASARLTTRETQVLGCVAQGFSNREIARSLGISERTVQRHLANIFGKLGVLSRTAAAAYAFRHGLLPG